MNASRLFSWIRNSRREIELALLLTWLIFQPAKQTHLYYLVCAFMVTVFARHSLVRNRNFAFSSFHAGLLALNLVFLLSALAAPAGRIALSFCADLLVLSAYFLFFDFSSGRENKPWTLIMIAAGASSLLNLLFWPLNRDGQLSLLFANPILQGIVSGLGLLLCLQFLLTRTGPRIWLLCGLAVNGLALAASGSKAAALGVLLAAAWLIARAKPRLLALLPLPILLLALLPNPLRTMTGRFISGSDPFALDRVPIWLMSGRMALSRPWLGLGPDHFALRAPAFNFAQQERPLRYGKLPESPHGDFLKVAVETGLPGLVLVLLFFVALGRRLARSDPGPAGLVLAFLVFQGLLFNFIFAPPFLLIFLLAAGFLFQDKTIFSSPAPPVRKAASWSLISILLVFFLAPTLAAWLADRSGRGETPIQAYNPLARALMLDPFNDDLLLRQAGILAAFSRAEFNLEAWTEARGKVETALRLNPLNRAALRLRYELLRDLERAGFLFPGLQREMLAALEQAAGIDPFNPFLELERAGVYLRQGSESQAEKALRRALELEPNFLAALCLKTRFAAPEDEPELSARIREVRELGRKLNYPAGSYGHEIFKLPPGWAD